jgi:simple sugar transport system permease protein
MLGGLGAALACLSLEKLPALVVLPLAILGAAAFGALWAFIPGYLQARRGSHVVITTIMFNFLAATLLVYLLVNVIGDPHSMQPQTRIFGPQARLPFMHDIAHALGLSMPSTPLNLSFPLALLAAWGVWLLVYRSRLGYAMRTVGANPAAAIYAGISPARVTMATMALSGALAAGLAVNEVMGVQQRLLLEFTSGYGFVGIAVALMGRAHPAGIVFAALLFGMLYQGGAELSFDHPAITRDMVTVIGGVLILFAGALDGLFRRAVAFLLPRRVAI